MTKKKLTSKELDLLAGAQSTGTTNLPPVNVNPPAPPPAPAPSPAPAPPPPPSGGGGGGSGGGGSSGYSNTSPKGYKYTYLPKLSQAQLGTINSILDYGMTNQNYQLYVRLAVDQAYYESSLGILVNNPTNNSVIGIYQYTQATWDQMGHSNLNINSDSDQIKAFYADILAYEPRFMAALANNQLPQYFTFEDYVEVKHHLGNNSTDWTNPIVSDYKRKMDALSFYPQ